MNSLFMEPGIYRVAYRHTEAWHTCLFIDVSRGQIYFVKRSRVGKINSGRKQFGKYSSRVHFQVSFFRVKFIEVMDFFNKFIYSYKQLKCQVCHSYSKGFRNIDLDFQQPLHDFFFFFFFYWVLPEGTSV